MYKLAFVAIFGYSFLFSKNEILKKPTPIERVALRCTGSSPCYACSNCSACKWCAAGGTCGICEPSDNKRPIKSSNNQSSKTVKQIPQSSGQCRATTKKGTQCSRSARTGGYCWQHGG